MTSEELDAAIATFVLNLSGPAKVSGDAGSVEQFSLKDQIEALKFLEDQTGEVGAIGPGRGLRITRLVMPGTTGDT